jgi:hypothetical protein
MKRDLIRLLDQSRFQNRYKVDAVFRGGLLAGALSSNLYEALSLLLNTRIAGRIGKKLEPIVDRDYFTPFGCLSYDIGIRIRKQ